MKKLMIALVVALGAMSAHAADQAAAPKQAMSAAVMPSAGAAGPALHPGKPATTAVIPGSVQAATTPANAPVLKVQPAAMPAAAPAPGK